jgi:hypothetical protein
VSECLSWRAGISLAARVGWAGTLAIAAVSVVCLGYCHQRLMQPEPEYDYQRVAMARLAMQGGGGHFHAPLHKIFHAWFSIQKNHLGMNMTLPPHGYKARWMEKHKNSAEPDTANDLWLHMRALHPRAAELTDAELTAELPLTKARVALCRFAPAPRASI